MKTEERFNIWWLEWWLENEKNYPWISRSEAETIWMEGHHDGYAVGFGEGRKLGHKDGRQEAIRENFVSTAD
jgi:hypothetical protein